MVKKKWIFSNYGIFLNPHVNLQKPWEAAWLGVSPWGNG